MGAASKVIHIILRVFEVICSVIVLGLVARFLHLVSQAGVSVDSRIVYAIITASISTLFALVFIAPFIYAYLAFPMDAILFVMWIVVFGLLTSRTGSAMCNASWYWNYWGYYWGGWWRVPDLTVWDRGYGGCASWRAVLAFSFLAAMAYLVSTILGAVVVHHYRRKNSPVTTRDISAPIPQSPATGRPETAQVHDPRAPPSAPAQQTMGTAVDV
ncbi:hypothetical protein QC764_502580 [Podospora pseudoanserina]|uniref:MARVEL domain-containing protein n=1 Tax=Podospora pseudoanserina TaxID=2609844 RepID=A0ABR0I3J0_9PEZI|nr:hypothetical protein QC764_502580 [Podospora pseudoanserina]